MSIFSGIFRILKGVQPSLFVKFKRRISFNVTFKYEFVHFIIDLLGRDI